MAKRTREKQSQRQSNSSDLSRELSASELRVLRMRAQCLAPRLPRKKLVEVVKQLCGVQAQLPSAMELALRARVEGLSIGDIEANRVNDRTLVRTWCMRGSMHLLATDDLDALLSAVSPSVIRDAWGWFEKKRGLEHDYAAAIVDEAYNVLKANGPMTRPALIEAVAAKHGSAAIPAAAGVVHLNGLLGRMCFGPDQGAKPTYAALDDWLGRAVSVSEDHDYAQLARRYLQGYGPATPRDFASWWGLPAAEARAAWASLEEELVEFSVEGQPVWMLSAMSSDQDDVGGEGCIVRLLPAFDTYLLGYHDRDVAVPPPYQDRVFHGGQLVPVVLVDGCAAGIWRYEQRGKRFNIAATPFASFTPEVRDLIAEEADDIGRFYRVSVTLNYSEN